MPDYTNRSEYAEFAGMSGTRAGMYSFLAGMFNRKPDINFVRRLRSLDVTRLDGMTAEHDSVPKAATGIQEIARFIESTAAEPDDLVVERLGLDWTRLFRGVAPGYGPEPPYEAVYLGGDFRTPDILMVIMKQYIEQDVAPSGQWKDRPDYIGVELDFLAVLAEREAAAWLRGDSADAEKMHRSACHFLNNHLGKWVETYCGKAMDLAQTSLYKGVLQLVLDMVTEVKTVQLNR